MVIKKLGDIARKQIEGDTEMENEKRLEVAKNMLSATKVEDKKRLLTISNDLYCLKSVSKQDGTLDVIVPNQIVIMLFIKLTVIKNRPFVDTFSNY